MAYNIGLWGPSASGKTAYLCQLFLHALHSPWKVFPSAGAEEFLRTARAEVEQNRFPAATGVGTYAKVTYALKSPDGSDYSLTLADQAGIELELLTDKTKGELNAADALMLLFDSEEDTQRIESRLDAVLSGLHMDADRGVMPDSRPVAICLTKVDRLLLTREELDFAVQHPCEFVRERIDEHLDVVASRLLGDYRFFPVSAAGVYVQDRDVRKATFYDEALELRLAGGGEPVNLLAPFEWLVGRLEGADNTP